MAYIYAVTNQKGGVGKTTTCICLGAALAEKGKRVLLVDLDPQGGLTTSLGFDPDALDNTIYNVFVDESASMTSVVRETKTPGVCFVPANLDLAGAEGELLGEIGWDRTLKIALGAVQEDYDYILLDCPPSLGVLTTNALIASQRVIIPVQTEYLAMRGLKQLTHVLAKVRRKGNPEIAAKVLRTLHQARTIHSSEAASELEGVLEGQLYETIIRRTIKFAEASVAGESILSYSPKSQGAMMYRELAKEVLQDE